MPVCAGVRRFGAASLDLAYVASGRYDGFWERGLQSWDTAAGILLVKEAGGLVEPINKENDVLEDGELIVGNEIAFDKFAKIIRDN
jgi:myo-inositol-1(or 4)-monophosphatase